MSTTDVRLPSEQESRQLAEQARQKEWEGRGFLRELFLGTFQLDLIHPFPLRPEDRPEFARFYDELKTFLRQEVDSAAIDQTGEYPEHVVDGLRKLGAFGMKIPKEYGGAGVPGSPGCQGAGMGGGHDGKH